MIVLFGTGNHAQTLDGEPIRDVLPKDAIQSIKDPDYVSGEAADSIMQPEEQVLGILGPKGTAVAYSTWHLDSHEIVNDRIDGTALAITW